MFDVSTAVNESEVLRNAVSSYLSCLLMTKELEDEPAFQPVIKTEIAVQEKRLAVIDSALGNDERLIEESIHQYVTASIAFYFEVRKWHNAPLSECLLEREEALRRLARAGLEKFSTAEAESYVQQESPMNLQLTEADQDVLRKGMLFCKRSINHALSR